MLLLNLPQYHTKKLMRTAVITHKSDNLDFATACFIQMIVCQ
jgi:hypothetical protein